MNDYHAFDPRTYLDEYYAQLPPENLALLGFLVEAFAHVPAGGLALDFGAGPSLYSAIAAAPHVRELHLCEYAPANRAELTRWLNAEPDAFDWSDTIRAALRAAGQPDDLSAVQTREALIRQRVTSVMPCDLLQPFPLDDPTACGRYDVLVSNLCAEAAAPNHAVWRACIARMAELLKPNGHIILSAVKRSSAYSVGRQVFRVLPIDESDVLVGLRGAGFEPATITLSSTPADHPVYPYEGLIFATARKSTA
jgi:hypothetical protein